MMVCLSGLSSSCRATRALDLRAHPPRWCRLTTVRPFAPRWCDRRRVTTDDKSADHHVVARFDTSVRADAAQLGTCRGIEIHRCYTHATPVVSFLPRGRIAV